MITNLECIYCYEFVIGFINRTINFTYLNKGIGAMRLKQSNRNKQIELNLKYFLWFLEMILEKF